MADRIQQTSFDDYDTINNNNDALQSCITKEKNSFAGIEVDNVFEYETKNEKITTNTLRFSREFCTQFGISCVVNLMIFISGSHIGWVGPTILKLSSNNSEIPLTSTEISWLAAMVPLGGGIGPIFGAILANKIGRKTTILFTTIPEIITWIVIAFAKNNYHLCLAQFTKGLIGGSATAVVPMYLGEISSSKYRGFIGMIFSIQLTSGILFEIVLVPYVSLSLNAWIASFVPIILFSIFIWMPESPYYFLIKNQTEKARKSLRILKQSDNIDKQLEYLQKAVQEEQNEVKSFSEIFRIRNNRNSFIICLGIMSTQFLTGLSIITPYTQIILEKSNSSLDPNVGGIIIGFSCVIFTIISSLIIDIWGRRPLLLVSTFGAMIPCFLIGVYFHLYHIEFNHINSISLFPFIGIFLYKTIASFGIIPLPYIYLSEMLSTNIKGFASLFICCYGSICHGIWNKSYAHLCDIIGMHNVFYLLVLGCFVSGIGTYFYVPETKGKTLEEIQKFLKTY